MGISYAQIGRYETKGAQPPAETLKKIADALDVTPDFLIYGTSDEKAKTKLTDIELINQFKAIESMDDEDKTVIKKTYRCIHHQKTNSKISTLKAEARTIHGPLP